MPYPYSYSPFAGQQFQQLGAFQPMTAQTVPTVFPSQPTNGIVKVNGRESAMQYQLPPNSTSPALFDNNGKVFYVVSTDGTGTKSIEVFDFSPHVEEHPVVVDGVEFASKKELDELAAKVGVIMEVIHGSNAAVPATVPAARAART